MIEEANLQDTARKVQEVPPEERRIIVYTGVHPHEGTTELARPHEDRWKKYGVLVVAHPHDSTPHAIWQRQKELCVDGLFRPLDHSINMYETDFENAFAGKESTLFLRFHGTAIPWFTEQTGDKLAKCASKRRLTKDTCYTRHTHPEPFKQIYRDFSLMMGTSSIPSDRLAIEYMYEGWEVNTDDPFVKLAITKANEKYPNGVLKIFCEDDTEGDSFAGRKINMHPDYLIQHRLSDADIKDFHSTHVKVLDEVIARLSEYYR